MEVRHTQVRWKKQLARRILDRIAKEKRLGPNFDDNLLTVIPTPRVFQLLEFGNNWRGLTRSPLACLGVSVGPSSSKEGPSGRFLW